MNNIKARMLCVGLLLSSFSMAAAVLQQSVAFVSNRDGNAHIYITRGDNTDTALTKGQSNNIQPAWSPDGQMIAFSSMRDGVSAIFLMKANGSDIRRLNVSKHWQSAPSWSPDGKALAYFVRDSSKPGVELHISAVQGDKHSVIAVDGRDKGPDAPVWSADGQSLAFLAMADHRKGDVWLINRDGSGLRNISESVSKRNKAHPAFSPDGKALVYIADMRGYIGIIRTDLQSGESINLTQDSPASYERPRWSPDGKKLTFASTRDDPALTRMDVFIMNADGSGVQNLSQHPHEDFNPHWTADGQSIVFTSLRSGTAQIYAYDLQKKSAIRITDNASHDMDQVPQPVTMTSIQTAASAQHGDSHYAK